MTTPTPQDPLTATDPHSPPNEPTHTNLTELAEQLDKARQAFEQATPTGHFRHQIEGYAARLHLAEQDLAQERRNHAGMSRGELDRLRKVEAALVELGAPNHSTRDDPAGPMITWAQKVATERVQLRAELATMKADAVELPGDAPDQLDAILSAKDSWDDERNLAPLISLIESWRGTKPAATEELPPNEVVYQATSYVADLVLAATGSWPGWSYPDEVSAAVDEALREIKRLRAEATRALRSGSDALANAAARMENGRRELVALLRDHPGGGLVHEPGNWEETLNVVRAHLVHRKLDKEFRTNLVQAVRRWVPAGEPVSDWQMLHLVGQLADQAARWFDAATEKPAATTASAPDSAGPVTFIDERGRAQTYTLDQVLDAVKHSDKGDGNNW